MTHLGIWVESSIVFSPRPYLYQQTTYFLPFWRIYMTPYANSHIHLWCCDNIFCDNFVIGDSTRMLFAWYAVVALFASSTGSSHSPPVVWLMIRQAIYMISGILSFYIVTVCNLSWSTSCRPGLEKITDYCTDLTFCMNIGRYGRLWGLVEKILSSQVLALVVFSFQSQDYCIAV